MLIEAAKPPTWLAVIATALLLLVRPTSRPQPLVLMCNPGEVMVLNNASTWACAEDL